MENIDGKLLEYYAAYNKAINEDYIHMLFTNNYFGNISNIYLNINAKIQEKYSAEEYLNYINFIDKTNLVQYINAVKNLYDSYKKIIMEDNYSQLLEIINTNENVDKYIVSLILRENKSHALNLILETCDTDKINNLLLLYSCSNSKFIDMVTIFMNHGADIRYNNNNLLLKSIYSQDINNVKFLLDNGIDANAENGIIFATVCYIGKIEIIKLFISYGVTNENLNKGLVYALFNDKIHIMKLLIENGADTHILDDMKLPLYDSNKMETLHWLENNGVNMISFLGKINSSFDGIAKKMNW